MFDTMTMTKIIGGLSGTLLVFLLGNWAAEAIYHVGSEEGGSEEKAMAYPIAVEGATAEPAAEEAAVDFASLYAVADAAAGEKVFGKCRACHKIEAGANGTGPTLFGVVDRAVGSSEGYGYSAALSDMGGTWTPEALFGFLESPGTYASGTKMSFKGLPDPEDRANLIAYLATIGS